MFIQFEKEVINLLSSILENGERICLADSWDKSTLQVLREKETFLCPQCHETVILKLGNKRTFHFSHYKGTQCQFEHENESDYHLNGKKQLYQWLRQQDLYPQMEYYDGKLKQRADIVFYVGYKKYALEYQCSNISEDIFRKRTQGYLENDYHPIWIVGAKHFKRKKNSLCSLSDFHFLFLQKYPSNTWMIPYYCSETQKFILQKSLQPISTRSVFSKQLVVNLENMSIEQLILPKEGPKIDPTIWVKEVNFWKHKQLQNRGSYQNPFLNALYQNHLNLFLLPPFLGLPVPDSPVIITSPVIWQAYLFIDILLQRGPNAFHIHDVYSAFKKRIVKKHIQLRNLPYDRKRDTDQEKFFNAIKQYVQLLVRLHILKEINQSIFQLEQPLYIPKTEMEQRQMEEIFYRKYANIIF